MKWTSLLVLLLAALLPSRMHAAPQVVGTPNTHTVSSGLWSDPSNWSNGVPGVDDVAAVSAGTVMMLDQDATVLDLSVSGLLGFNNGETLAARTIMVTPTGTLEIKGSGHIEFRPIPASDIEQQGLGLMVAGSFFVDGGEKLPYARATHDIVAGSDQIILGQNVCDQWSVGDQIVIGSTTQKGFIGSRPFDGAFEQNHVATITEAIGDTITFDPPTPYDCPGIATNSAGVTAFAPVGNLTRPVTLRSLDPDTLEHRAHSMLMDGGKWDVRGAAFIGMGRTDPSVPVHPTDNIIGRYALHFHRIQDPASVGMLRHCVIQDYGKWGISVHEGADCLIADNFFFDGVGSAMVTERGNEVRNKFLRNLVIQVVGGYQLRNSRGGITLLSPSNRPAGLDGNADFAVDGTGFWGRRVGNDLIGNIFCSCAGYGVNLNGYYSEAGGGGSSQPTLPVSPSPGVAPQGGFHSPPPGITIDNEVISSWGGVWLTYSQGKPAKDQDTHAETAIYDNFVCWNISEHYIEAFHDGNVEFNNFVAVSDPAVDRLNRGANNGYARRTFFLRTSKNYEMFDLVLNDCIAEGVNVAIEGTRYNGNGVHPEGQWGSVTANNCNFDCYVGIYINERGNPATVLLNNTNFNLTTDHQQVQGINATPTLYSYE